MGRAKFKDKIHPQDSGALIVDSSMTNAAKAGWILDQLCRAGVSIWTACAGARNAPLLDILFESKNIELMQLFDERSAGFFTLGRAKITGAPAAVVTTSGTSAAELLPSVIEAYYSMVPLVLVTADRPARFRGTGAPQSIEQVGIYGQYVEKCIDVEDCADLFLEDWSKKKPLHINVRFDEPLLNKNKDSFPNIGLSASKKKEISSSNVIDGSDRHPLSVFIEQCRNPLVILSELDPSHRDCIADFLSRFNAPVWAEGLSQCREDTRLERLRLKSGDRFIKTALEAKEFDGVLRIGGVPTLRTWRDLDRTFGHIPVLSLSERPFSGLGLDRSNAGLHNLHCLYTWKGVRNSSAKTTELLERDCIAASKMNALLDSMPMSEQSLVKQLSQKLPKGAFVYLGNSLPIRHWDLVAQPPESLGLIAGNRGANGIDGQISTFFGMCLTGRANLAIVGDLTALYDSQGFFIASKLAEQTDAVIAVINNCGGRIFENIFENERFQNRHSLTFEHLAKHWSLNYAMLSAIPKELSFGSHKIMEIRPDHCQTKELNDALNELWRGQ